MDHVLNSSLQFENGLQNHSPWKSDKKNRRATICPNVQKSPKLAKNSRKSVPGKPSLSKFCPKIKLDGVKVTDGPLKRRKKSAKQIEKAEAEYAFFDSSQDEMDIDEGGDKKTNPDDDQKLAKSTPKSTVKKSSKTATPKPKNTPFSTKAKSRARQTAKKSSISASSSSKSPQKSVKKVNPKSSLGKVKTAVLKAKSPMKTPIKAKKILERKNSATNKTPANSSSAKISGSDSAKTPAKKSAATNTPIKKAEKNKTKKTPKEVKPPAVGTRKSRRNIELSK